MSDSYDDSENDYENEDRHKHKKIGKVESNICKLISGLAHDTTRSEHISNLQVLVDVLEHDLPSMKANIMQLIFHFTLKNCLKLSSYVTLIGLLNLKNSDFGQDMIKMFCNKLQEFIDNGDYNDAVYVMIVLSDLVNANVINYKSILDLFESITNFIITDDCKQNRGDYLLYIILVSLPTIGKTLHIKDSLRLYSFLSNIEEYMESRSRLNLELFRVWSIDYLIPEEDVLDCVWNQVKLFWKKENWIDDLNLIEKPYSSFTVELDTSVQHDIESLKIGKESETVTTAVNFMHLFEPKKLLPISFKIFDSTDVESMGKALPGNHSITRFILSWQVRYIIKSNFDNKKACSIALVNQFDSNVKISHYHIVVEILFEILFSEHDFDRNVEIIVASMIIEICKLQPKTLHHIVAYSVHDIMNKMNNMSISCIERFVKWFALHLNNFQVKWEWEEWIKFVIPSEERTNFTLSYVAIRELINNLTDLSFCDKINKDLSQEYQSLMIQTRDSVDICDELDEEKMKIVEDIKKNFRNKTDMSYFKSLVNDAADFETIAGIFVTTLLRFSDKTISFTISAISKYFPIFKIIASHEKGENTILNSLFFIWKNNNQIIEILIDKLIKIEVLTCLNVITYLFTVDPNEMARFYVWRIFNNSIKKMICHVMSQYCIYEACIDDYSKCMKTKEAYVTAYDSLNSLFIRCFSLFNYTHEHGVHVDGFIDYLELRFKNFLKRYMHYIAYLPKSDISECLQDNEKYFKYYETVMNLLDIKI
ncbi:Nuclear cap-binding protein subunit 1 [Intoshia linei]|uniref:Nuclear cap-binding protein subunit 1 n=1 Tax=Intoshia linei TaxID=1819745 RepID=A0A177B5F9_9BILA|nr:Nuclear cap-binding protein subunit 1 [Intoshia linei]